MEVVTFLKSKIKNNQNWLLQQTIFKWKNRTSKFTELITKYSYIIKQINDL